MACLAYQKDSLRCRLAHLMDSWGRKRKEIDKENSRMLGEDTPPEGMTPTLFGKFRKFLTQIDFFREKERNIISEINEVEQKHRCMRASKLLKRADPNKAQPLPGLDEDYEAGTVQTFIMTFVNGTTWTFNAVVKDLGTDTPFDGKVGFSATLKVSGKPVLGVMLSDFLSGMDFEDSVGVKTSIPALADDTYTYSLTIDTDSSYVKITVTQEAAVTIVASCLGVSHNLTTGVQSGEIAVGDTNTTTLLTVTASDTGKSPRVYTIYVVRP